MQTKIDMGYEVVPLTAEHLEKLPLPRGLDRRAYFSEGSASFCVLADGQAVFAGGVVNLQWGRGEAWILPTPFFRSNLKTCLWTMREFIPYIAGEYGFHRVQATCLKGISASLFRHLGFAFEGTMRKFGPNGETCDMWARFFEVSP